jgi:hypothetical protein
LAEYRLVANSIVEVMLNCQITGEEIDSEERWKQIVISTEKMMSHQIYQLLEKYDSK